MQRRDFLVTSLSVSGSVVFGASRLGAASSGGATLRTGVRFNVKQFGARGDGQTDDTKAIRKALAVVASLKSASLYFPQGRYLFTSLDADVGDLEMYGVGAVLVSTLPIGSVQPAVWLRGERLWLHDLAISYAESLDILDAGTVQSRKPNSYGLRLGGRRDPALHIAGLVVVERVKVEYARGGGLQISYASNVTVRDCEIRQALGNGLGFDNCTEKILAENNIISHTGDDLLVVVTDKLVPRGTRGVVFRNNTVSYGFAKGIASSGVDGLLVENNTVSDTFGPGITAFSDAFYSLGKSKNVVICGNTVTHAGVFFHVGWFRDRASSVGNSVYIAGGSENVVVANNTLRASVRGGVVVTTIVGLKVENNKIMDHPGVGIAVGDQRSHDVSRVRDFSIIDNDLINNRAGIIVGSASHGRVSGNRFGSEPGKVRESVSISNCVDVSE